MDAIRWDEDWSVGVELLDSQHRSLVALINRLDREEKTGGLVSRAFDELEDYIRTHFRDEERLMAVAGYPDLAEHRAQHEAFGEWLRAVQLAYNSGGSSPYYIADSVNAFLKDWLVNHILKSDKAYAPYLAGRAED